MSVFKRPGAEFYSYDFRLKSRRFSGSTGKTSKRDAEKWEAAEKARIKSTEIDTSKPMTFAAAASQYWHEIGQHHAEPASTFRILGWLEREIGRATMIADINDAIVAKLVARKRSETKGNSKGAGAQPISAATVNRSMVEPLRGILRRAGDMWGQKVQRIAWQKHKLREPQERVREASAEEEATILAAIPADYAAAVRFAILTGCRRGEIVGLKWRDVNFFSSEFRVTGKGDRSRTVPMTQQVYDLLRDLRRHDGPDVFTFEAKRTRDGRVKGQRYAITAEGFHTMWHRHVRKHVTDFRFHDTRHTAATRLVRATGSIKMAQRLLGHTNVTTTTRYAHVTHDDLRQGMEAVERAQNSTPNATTAAVGEAKVKE